MNDVQPLVGGEDIIIGVADGLEAARWYGCHVGRRVVAFDDLDAVAASGLFSTGLAHRPRTCLMSPGSNFSTARLQAFVEASHDCGLALGLIAGWADEAAGMRHVASLIRADWTGSTDALFLGGFSPLSGTTGGVEVMRSGDRRIADRLVAGVCILGLVSHGNGIDAPVGAEVMCSMAGDVDLSRRVSTASASLPCRHGGPCIRGSQTSRGYVDPPRFDPARIRADVMIWCTCWGIMGSDAVFDPSASVARQLVIGGGVGALLSSYHGAPPDAFSVLLAAQLLRTGATTGEALLAVNAPSVHDPRPRWVLLGDPATRVAVPDRAVAAVADGPTGFTMEVQPGLFSVPIGAEVTTVTAEHPDTALAARSFALRPMKGAGRAVGVLLGDHPLSIDFRTWSATRPAPAVDTLRCIWSAAANLRFAASFFDWAERAGYAITSSDDPDLDSALRSQAERGGCAMAVPDLEGVLSGSHRHLMAEAQDEVRRWVGLNRRVHAALATCTRSFGGRLDRVYGDLSPRRLLPESTECRYCGTQLDAELLSPPPSGEPRLVLQCPRCRVVSDSPQPLGGVWLEGDETVRAGSVATLTLCFDSPPPRFGCLHGSLTFGGELPWSAVAEAQTTWRLGSGRAAVEPVPLKIRIRKDAPAGRYFVIAPVVVDGALAAARRPIVVLPPNSSS